MWQQEFDGYQAVIDGQPILVHLDLAAVREGPASEWPWRVRLAAALRWPGPVGLGLPEEQPELEDLEEEMVGRFTGGGFGVYVARVLHRGRIELVFYVAGEPPAIPVAGREHHVACALDPSWRFLREVLAPSAVDAQRIANRRLVAQLHGRGDRSEIPRSISHRIRLVGQASADRAADALVRRGFSIGWTPAGLSVQRVDAPDAIDAATDEILGALTGCEAAYDGWSCEALR